MGREFLVIGYKANADEVAELKRKVAASGLNRSEFLRRLVSVVEIEPPKLTVKTNNHCVTVESGAMVVGV